MWLHPFLLSRPLLGGKNYKGQRWPISYPRVLLCQGLQWICCACVLQHDLSLTYFKVGPTTIWTGVQLLFGPGSQHWNIEGSKYHVTDKSTLLTGTASTRVASGAVFTFKTRLPGCCGDIWSVYLTQLRSVYLLVSKRGLVICYAFMGNLWRLCPLTMSLWGQRQACLHGYLPAMATF